MKKLIYIDMDDTIADFRGHPNIVRTYPDVAAMYEPGFFLELKPIEGSQVAVRQLIRMGYDVQILTQPIAESAHSYSEKAQWIGLHFPELYGKVNMTQDKGLFRGDYLIDDNATKWKDKFNATGGKFILFPYNPGDRTSFSNRERWEQIVFFFQKELESGK